MNATPAQTFTVESVARVDGALRAVRAHERLETTVAVRDGVVCVAFADEDWILTPGDAVTVPAGMPFRLWNAGDDDARLVETFRVVCATPDCPESPAALSA